MGQRGPLPKTTARKRLEGNPGHRPLPDDEPEPRLLAAAPSPPDWLPELGRDAWCMITRELIQAEMMAALDLPILEFFCVSYASWRKMLVEVQTMGYTQEFYDNDGNLKYSQPTPAATLLTKFTSDCNRWAKVLGLGPAYRVGLRIGDRDGKTQPVDPIAAMLQSGGGDHNPPPKRSAAKRAKKASKRAVKKKAKKRAKKKSTRSAKKKA